MQLDALGDATRRAILVRLLEGPLPVGQLARDFPISRPAISQHLKTLREAKLVKVRAQAQRRIYELDEEGIAKLADWVNNLRRFWSGKLDALEEALRK